MNIDRKAVDELLTSLDKFAFILKEEIRKEDNNKQSLDKIKIKIVTHLKNCGGADDYNGFFKDSRFIGLKIVDFYAAIDELCSCGSICRNKSMYSLVMNKTLEESILESLKKSHKTFLDLRNEFSQASDSDIIIAVNTLMSNNLIKQSKFGAFKLYPVYPNLKNNIIEDLPFTSFSRQKYLIVFTSDDINQALKELVDEKVIKLNSRGIYEKIDQVKNNILHFFQKEHILSISEFKNRCGCFKEIKELIAEGKIKEENDCYIYIIQKEDKKNNSPKPFNLTYEGSFKPPYRHYNDCVVNWADYIFHGGNK